MSRPPRPQLAAAGLPAGLGLDCYASPDVPGFRGVIKMRPQDFIVIELDSEGRAAALEEEEGVRLPKASTQQHPHKPNDGTAHKLLQESHHCTSLQPSHSPTPHFQAPHTSEIITDTCAPQGPQHIKYESSQLSKGLNITPDPYQSPKRSTSSTPDPRQPLHSSPLLCDLISPYLYQQLVAMSTQCKATPTADAPPLVSLGVVSEKEKRAILHEAVRLTFPSLSTSTSRNNTNQPEINISIDTKYKQLRELLGHEECQRVLVYVNCGRQWTHPLKLNPDPCKDHRRMVHRTLDELYGKSIVTYTHSLLPHSSHRPPSKRPRQEPDVVESKQITVQFRSNLKHKVAKQPHSDIFTRFVLCKVNMETQEAVRALSEALSCHSSQLAYAGTKDTRAITTQHMTVRGVTPSQLSSLPHIPRLTIGGIKSTHKQLQLGELKGNNFKINMRNLAPSRPLKPQQTLDDVVEACMTAVEDKGFVNYFGPQRFGWSGTAPLIGLAMLQGNHERAVELLLSPEEDGNGPVQEAKQYMVSTGDIAGCLKNMPSSATRERLVLKALHHHGNTEYGCMRALCSIPYRPSVEASL